MTKSFLGVCAVAFLAGSLGLRGADTPAQIKAREALRQKINELQAPQASAPAPAAPSAKPAFAPVAPAAPAPAPPAAPAPAPVSAPPAAAPIPVVTPPGAEPSFSPVPPASEDPAAAKAREALREKISALQPQPDPGSTVQTEENAIIAGTKARQEAGQATESEANFSQAQAATGYKPLEGPASPISGSKEARLADLLQKYRADEITPEQYHTQRAKILAEP